ncbi:MAG: UvrD-helicase domain-containing protein, partial [Bacteroidota bacterium]|nr:UvrD-helicase domain-containing protein [Bacteroidota bacterium]
MENLDFLNKQQKSSVLSASKRLLVLAGAGSGKTKTLLQKIIYLIEEKGVKSSEILAITFTKNAANEMIDRLIISADKTGNYQKILEDKNITFLEKNNVRFQYSRKFKWINNLTIKTFHAFCYKVLKDWGVNEFDNKFKIIDDKNNTNYSSNKNLAPEASFEIFHKLLINKCNSNKQYLIDLKRYVLDYFIDFVHIKKQSKHYYHNNRKFYTTLNGTKVRSKSEQFIGDWFFRRNITFEYEPKVNIVDFQFRPDFYIPSANIYIEHVSNI